MTREFRTSLGGYVKKVIEAPRFQNAYISAEEHARIEREVTEALAAARRRREEAVPAHACAATASSTPLANRGGKSEIAARLVLEDGKCKEIPGRRLSGGEVAMIDWVNFTTDERDYWFGLVPINEEQQIDRVSWRCKEIFGFGVTEQRKTGANFYQSSYVLGEGYGLVCYGGQKNTVLVSISGTGCAAAKEGWEKRLYDFLIKCGPRAKLTRVDLAHDDYEGRYTVDKALDDYRSKLFNCGGRNPTLVYGGDWENRSPKGRTLYVGNRENGKFARIYEKGKKEGKPESPWVRIEVEFKSCDRILPFEMLLDPGQYLAAAYPAFGFISERQERIITTQKTLAIAYDAAIHWARQQVGGLINVMLAVETDPIVVVQKLIRDVIPKRLKLPGYQFSGPSLDETRIQPDRELFDNLALA